MMTIHHRRARILTEEIHIRAEPRNIFRFVFVAEQYLVYRIDNDQRIILRHETALQYRRKRLQRRHLTAKIPDKDIIRRKPPYLGDFLFKILVDILETMCERARVNLTINV